MYIQRGGNHRTSRGYQHTIHQNEAHQPGVGCYVLESSREASRQRLPWRIRTVPASAQCVIKAEILFSSFLLTTIHVYWLLTQIESFYLQNAKERYIVVYWDGVSCDFGTWVFHGFGCSGNKLACAENISLSNKLAEFFPDFTHSN